MSIKITAIEGRRGSACNNDAYSVVRQDENGNGTSIAIIPHAEIAGKPYNQVRQIFAEAVADQGDAVVQDTVRACNRLPLLGLKVA